MDDGMSHQFRALLGEHDELKAQLRAAQAEVARLAAELKTANHWRERHCRDAQAASESSAANWDKVQRLTAENEALRREALTVVGVLEEYEAQWGDDFLAQKWGLKDASRAAVEFIKKESK